jgi:outer membrane murein-binding lipoprotein Lpp
VIPSDVLRYELSAKVTHAAREPLLARIAELEADRRAPVVLVPQGYKITEEQHVAAPSLLHRAAGVDGLPQRMLDAMLAAAPQPQGWKLVPLDPTNGMVLSAAGICSDKNEQDSVKAAYYAMLAAAPQPPEAAQKIEDFVVQVEATNAEVGKLKAEVGKLQQQLIAEAKKAAEEKLRADQLDKQHTMQSRMHVEANQNLVALQASAPPALPGPVAWLATFSPKGMLSSRSIAGANLEELKRSVPSDSVFKPLYAHHTGGEQ